MIDINAETLLPLAEAAKTIPPARHGKRAHLSTLLRWVLKGAKAPDGSLVKLEGIRLGGRWLTSRQALQRFAERLTPDLEADRPRPPRSPGARERAARRAEKELERIGI
jgi:hypothetical protein